MKQCMCSIFNTREERLIEEDGRVVLRLICNVCGCLLDSREEKSLLGKSGMESSMSKPGAPRNAKENQAVSFH